jgi:hypothetical protein
VEERESQMTYYFPAESEGILEEISLKLIRMGLLDFEIVRLGGGSMLVINLGETRF